MTNLRQATHHNCLRVPLLPFPPPLVALCVAAIASRSKPHLLHKASAASLPMTLPKAATALELRPLGFSATNSRNTDSALCCCFGFAFPYACSKEVKQKSSNANPSLRRFCISCSTFL